MSRSPELNHNPGQLDDAVGETVESLYFAVLANKFGIEKAAELLEKSGPITPTSVQALIRFETNHVRNQGEMDKLVDFELRLQRVSRNTSPVFEVAKPEAALTR
ncbi:MAG: hypothetical protein COU66_02180 [Candidatus Pacebacteria bacterium CG10_big_fil_rev_8_21_14_0_10_44_11]|nr:MAG: hypothetical protein COU66_02180 [Candidatus Pacebacteria bacterium CG10_big_fil_rev_8_21_14_0_10_44_11]